MKNTREEIMTWWNNLSSLIKTQICDTNTEIIGSPRRWETLTGSEIKNLYFHELKNILELIHHSHP